MARRLLYKPNRSAKGPAFRLSSTIGGANPAVQKASEDATKIADESNSPSILASIYKPPASVNTNAVIGAVAGEPKVEQIYVPVTKKAIEEVRPASEKLKNWFLKGVWA